MKKPSKQLNNKISVLRWIDDHLLLGISLFLLGFIPLYPKWPLFDVLPGYIVRVRLEDFLILGAVIIWLIYLLRGKVKLKRIPLAKPIAAYLAVGFLSVLSAIFITKTVYPEFIQIAKVFLHFFRRIEYFSLFFIFFSSLKSKRQVWLAIGLLYFVVLAISIYGFGQKYLYWPAYSTMNREFSKGIVLYLTEHARVLSTFGGHYDLAAYIMLTLPILIVVSFLTKKVWVKIGLWLVSLVEFWLLILTASRTSFIAYLVAVSVIFGLLALKKDKLWALKRWTAVVGLSLLIMASFGDLSERFVHVLRLEQIKNAVTSPFRYPPINGIPIDESLPLDEQLKRIASKSDVPPSKVKPDQEVKPKEARPVDVYIDPYNYEPKTGEEGGGSLSYSDNALKFGLSTGIRLDVLWPKAWAGFKRNPLLGTGYSTLVKTRVWEFTQAESTDNDYLRLLGETGLLGFITFISIFGVIIVWLYRALIKSTDLLLSGIFAAGIGITAGLMVNALYIDVFEASKVAYAYWSLMGLFLALAVMVIHEKK